MGRREGWWVLAAIIMEYLHLVTHNLVYYLEGLDFSHLPSFPTGLQDYGQDLMSIIVTRPRSQSAANVWLVIYQASLALLWVLVLMMMLMALTMNMRFRGPTVTITGRDTTHRVMEMPVSGGGGGGDMMMMMMMMMMMLMMVMMIALCFFWHLILVCMFDCDR